VNDVSSKKLPQRAMDEAANNDDRGKCWIWPSVKAWPAGMKPLPEGYSASIKDKGEGYGQFVLKAERNDLKQIIIRQISPYAHILSYRYFNLDKDVTLTVKNDVIEGIEDGHWVQRDYPTKTIEETIKYDDGTSQTFTLTLGRVIRHHPLNCKSKSCVNPFHLDIGDTWQNTEFDEVVKATANSGTEIIGLTQEAANAAQSVVTDFHNGITDAKKLVAKHSLTAIDIVKIALLFNLSLDTLGRNTNAMGFVDNKPKDMR
jgi:hypothetical protein